ncbi:hypothetical protein DIZ73_18340, partial [Legionella pneumophila]
MVFCAWGLALIIKFIINDPLGAALGALNKAHISDKIAVVKKADTTQDQLASIQLRQKPRIQNFLLEYSLIALFTP